MLASGAGVIVPFYDPGAFAVALTGLLVDAKRLDGARRAARTVGHKLTWSRAAALVRWAARAGVGGVCIRAPAGWWSSVTTGLVNDATLAARAAALGVDAVTTDRPAALHDELAGVSLAA